MDFGLIIPAFIAGLLTFLAPCTLPLVPGYLSFVSGVSLRDIRSGHIPATLARRIMKNALWFVVGFSTIFIAFGVIFGVGGLALAQYRIWLMRIGGVFIIIFGLQLMRILHLPGLDFLNGDHRLRLPSRWVRPGEARASFLFGAAFAFGWSPCVGPILGTILFLASTTATVFQGAVLLAVFAVGLAIPFLLTAYGLGTFSGRFIHHLERIAEPALFVGGLLLVILGFLFMTDMVSTWVGYFYGMFGFLRYVEIVDYL